MMKKMIVLSLLCFAAPTYASATDCAAVGQRVATQQGGQLTEVEQIVENDQQMCVVIVLVPGQDGEKPRRVEVAVPAN